MTGNLRLKEYRGQYTFLSMLRNVKLNFGPVANADTHPLEQVYLFRIFEALSKWEQFYNYNFYIISANSEWSYELDKKSIVLYMSNEDHVLPSKLEKALMVFTPYCPLGAQCPQNCFAIPLGYNGALEEKEFIPIEKRTYDVFFSGNMYKRRLPFWAGVQFFSFKTKIKMESADKHHLQFNRSFTGGMSSSQYSDILMNSKIALVPEGYKSNISFRFFEAAKYGTVIITKKLYDYWFFREFPGVEVDSWLNVGKYIRQLLTQPDLLETYQKKILGYYNTYCQEGVVAQFIIEKISIKTFR
ncbi:MAG: hypothetical protein GY810_05710 [Aureispira sp.]|nr:hypothetical protein [Aureispira sp.]